MGQPTSRSEPTAETVHAWRLLMTVVARSLHVSVGLVTRVVGDGELEYAAPSTNPENPYTPGELIALEAGVLCEQVITRRSELAVCDSRTQAEWADNPDARTGLLAYLGFPVFWPDGAIFGTICVLDRQPRDFTGAERALLLSARDLIHDSLGAMDASPESVSVVPAAAAGDSPSMGLWDHDPRTGTVRLSPLVHALYAELCGGSVETLAQWLNCFPRKYAEEWASRLHTLVTGEHRTASIGMLLPDGAGPRMVRIVGRGLRDADGEVMAVVGVHTVHDVDAGPEAGRRTDGITALLDGRGRVVQADPRLDELFASASSRELLSARLADAVIGHDLSEAVRRVRRGAAEVEHLVLEPVLGQSPYLASLTQVAAEGSRPRLRLRLLSEHPASPETHSHLDREPVTGLPTRRQLEGRLRAWWDEEAGYPGRVMLALVDVTNIRTIAREDGLSAADDVLGALADRLSGTGHFVATLGYGYLALLAQLHESVSITSFQEAVQEQARPVPCADVVEPIIEVSWTEVRDGADSRPDALLDRAAEALAHGVTDEGEDPRTPRLTERQREVAQLVAVGLSNKEIAEHLVIAVRTVEGHLDAIRERLDVRNRAQLVAFVLTHPAVCGTPQEWGEPRRLPERVGR